METLERIIKDEVLQCQNTLVEELFKNIETLYENIENEYPYNPKLDEYDYDSPKEIFQWWLVTDWLAEKLRNSGAVILEFGDCCWWGREGCGYSLEDESVLKFIAKEINGE